MNERLGIMCLSASLKAQGFKTRLAICDTLGIKKIKELINEYKPEVVGYSVMTGEHIKLLEVNRILKKEFKFISVFGGPHATFFPDLINEDGVDAICVGEGDVAFTEFCKRVSEGKDFWSAPNFLVKHGGKVIENEVLPLVENLDTLPLPDRDIMYRADRALYNGGGKIFTSSRGCPYHCTYCFNSKYNDLYKNKGSVVRYRSPENLIAEICAVIENYPVNVVSIVDDTFIAKPKEWFVRFVKLYKEKVKPPFSINVRANLVNEEIISLLKDGGLTSALIGIECGNQEIANSVLKRNLTNEQIINACSIIKKYNIKLMTLSLIGLPVQDSYSVDLETLDLNIKIKPTFALSSILYPYPGTPIESYARDNGLLSEKTPILETNKRASVFKFSDTEKKKITNLHKLFGLIVRLPFLRKYTDFLCVLPLTFLYVMLFYFWYGYNMKFIFYPFLSLRKEFFHYVSLWYRFLWKT